MIVIDFGLLRIAYTAKYLTYLLKSTEVIQIWEFDNVQRAGDADDSVCKVGFMANVGNVFSSNVYKRFFFYFLHVFYVFNAVFLLFSSQRLLPLWLTVRARSKLS